ncbi:MAG TPA: hypothetical protein VFQ61_03280 [Polyangiaceae bacterium]|nr:hypothetical protein [Polyangiaceae bacterium]
MNSHIDTQVKSSNIVSVSKAVTLKKSGWLRRLLGDTRGAATMEYAAIVGIVVIAGIAVLNVYKTKLGEAKTTAGSIQLK